MNYTLFSLCANIFGFVAGGVSLLGFVAALCRPHLPSNKIRILEGLIHETESVFKEAVEAGLLGPEFVGETQENLNGLKERTSSLRARAYSVTTLSRDCTEFLRGTSSAIGLACQSVKKIRAEVITSSEERRRKLMQMNSQRTKPLPALPVDSLAQHCPIPTSTLIPRPCSRSPLLSSDDVPNTALGTNESLEPTGINTVGSPGGFSSDPSLDLSRADSEVRNVDVQL